VSDLNRSMHRSLWVEVAHSSFIEGSRMTKNTASEGDFFPFSMICCSLVSGQGDQIANFLINCPTFEGSL
jgi:hypothetical protein